MKNTKNANILQEAILSLRESKASLVTTEEKRRLQDFITILEQQKEYQMNQICKDIVMIAAALPPLLNSKRFIGLLGKLQPTTQLHFEPLSWQMVYGERAPTNMKSHDTEPQPSQRKGIKK